MPELFASSTSWVSSPFQWWMILLAVFIFVIFQNLKSRWFWLRIITWEFWSWKTLYTHISLTWGILSKLFFRKKHSRSVYIWNYKSSDFDIQFSSMADLLVILERLYYFKQDKVNRDFKINLILDEWTIYFNPRNFSNFPSSLIPFLVQLRKLNVSMVVIVQKLMNLDINFRRLVHNIIDYSMWIWIIRVSRTYILASEESLLEDPNNTVSMPSFLPWPSIVSKIRPLNYDTFEMITSSRHSLIWNPNIYLILDQYFPLIEWNTYSSLTWNHYYTRTFSDNFGINFKLKPSWSDVKDSFIYNKDVFNKRYMNIFQPV